MNLAKFLKCGAVVSLGQDNCLVGEDARTWIDVPVRDEQTAFYFPDFFLEQKHTAFVHEKMEELTLERLFEELSLVPHPPLDKLNWKGPDKKLFSQQFGDLAQYFEAGSLQKGVPYTFDHASGPFTPARILAVLVSAARYAKDNHLYMYGYWDEERGVIGVTPEVLVTMDHQAKTAKTVACAGTVPRGIADCESLKNPKLLEEHHLVVKGISETLCPYGTVITGKRFLLELPHLCHLVTPIRLQSRKLPSIHQLVDSLHPTPALGAYPKEAGKPLLENYQTSCDRGHFGAPVGLLNYRHTSVCYVAIRNVQWQGKRVAVGAGCGVVPKSIMEEEWEELLLKLSATKSMLGIA